MKKEEASLVWRKIAQYLITHMKRGYVEGLVKEYHTSDVSLIDFGKNNSKGWNFSINKVLSIFTLFITLKINQKFIFVHKSVLHIGQ